MKWKVVLWSVLVYVENIWLRRSERTAYPHFFFLKTSSLTENTNAKGTSQMQMPHNGIEKRVLTMKLADYYCLNYYYILMQCRMW
jgi:hypothetical protein